MRPTSLRRIALAAVLLLAASLAGPAAAAAAGDPDGHASCIGHEMAAISPPGSSGEFAAGAPQLIGEIKAIAAFLGVSPGIVISLIASLHEGSHEACDEALEG